MATMSSAPSLNLNAAQLLHNQMLERRPDQLTNAVKASLNFRKNNDYGSANRDQQFSRSRQFRKAKRSFCSVSNLQPRREMPSNTPQDNRFPLEPQPELIPKTFVSFMPALALKLESVKHHVLGTHVIPVTLTITLIICRSRKKFLPTRQSLFCDPCSNMRFLLDTRAEISMIPPCRYYKPYYGPQDLIAANGTPI